MLLPHLILLTIALTILNGMREPWVYKKTSDQVYVRLELYGWRISVTTQRQKTRHKFSLKTERKEKRKKDHD
jgi:hypothetical protein